MDRTTHWQEVYATKAPTAVSWYQSTPTLSLDLIRSVAPDPSSAAIIDVGAGASLLVDALLDAGYTDLTMLDIAGGALRISQERLGARASTVQWIEHDVRTVSLDTDRYSVWHDRAVFHFLTEPDDRAAYVSQLEQAVRAGGYVLIAAFAEDGPLKCSGLPVVRYTPEAMQAVLGDAFELLRSESELHGTPMGTQQSFVYCVFRKRP